MTTPAPPAPTVRKGRLALLSATHAVNDLYQAAIPAMLPFLMDERGYSYTAVSGLAFAASGVSSLSQPLFGVLTDRRTRAWLVPAGFCVAAAGVVAAASAPNYLITWLCVALAGLGIAAYHPPATSQARVAGGSSQKAMSVFSVGGTVGGALAPPLVTLTIGALGFSGGRLLAVPAAVMLLVWLWRGRIPAAPARRADAAPGAAGSGLTDDWRSFARLVAVIIGWSIPYVTVTSLVSLHAQRDLGQSAAAGAATLTCCTAAGAVGTLLGGWLGDRFGRLTALRAGYAAALPALCGVVFAPVYPVLVVSATLFGLALFVPYSAHVTLAQDYLPNRPGTASGLTLGLAMAAGGLCSPLFGRLADARGLTTTLAVLIAVFAVPVLLTWRLPERSPHGPVAGAPGDRPAPAPVAGGAR
ncbi:MFS transporter [Streptomyces sp. RFCAC02]|uniref:MFS transporter n=1 Tax=Streptomyces sp. RFCAC02 TaxID=2499143 RepID=UPI001F0DE604|nr:MFS transporter [Streptomyces sp. RFCAC02]